MNPNSPTLPVTSASYTFVERPSSEMYAVLLREGVYSGVIITYGKVQLVRPENEQPPVLRFSYTTNHAPDPYTSIELDNSPEFKNYLGEVLTHILCESLESGRYKMGKPTSLNVSTPNHNPSEAS
jgi:hypothetical protein